MVIHLMRAMMKNALNDKDDSMTNIHDHHTHSITRKLCSKVTQ